MQLKNLLTAALMAISMPSVMSKKGRTTFYESAPSRSQPPECGSDSKYLVDYYIALNKSQIKEDKPGLCGRCIKIVYDNKYFVGKLVDSCPDCGHDAIDIAPKMFYHFAERKVGVIYSNWEYVSCDHYGKRGTCSDSNCGMSSSSSPETKKKTTTTHATTTSTTTTTTTVNPTATVSTGLKPTASVNNTASATPLPSVKNNNGTQPNATTTQNNNNNKVTKVNVTDIENNSGKQEESNVVLPIAAGALMVTGAAGVGLVYMAKSKREGVQELKQKFPEAFKNIKRSLTHRSGPKTETPMNTATTEPEVQVTVN